MAKAQQAECRQKLQTANRRYTTEIKRANENYRRDLKAARNLKSKEAADKARYERNLAKREAQRAFEQIKKDIKAKCETKKTPTATSTPIVTSTPQP